MDLLTRGTATIRGAISRSLAPMAVTKSLAGVMTCASYISRFRSNHSLVLFRAAR
jgi:hypothetical protein